MGQRVLVTGGNGLLGRKLQPRLAEAGYTVRVMSRKSAPAGVNLEWAQADIASGEGVASAVAGADIIIHAASSPFKKSHETDVEGTRRLVAEAAKAGVSHLVYVSIVGVDRHPFFYYQNKLAAEEIVANGPAPWTILRASQFHDLIDMLLQASSRAPLVMPVASDMQFQSVDSGEVATFLVEAVRQGPGGRLPDVAGPQVMTLGEMAREWLAAQGQKRRIMHLWLPGKTMAAFRGGLNTNPARPAGRITWQEWLRRRYRAIPAGSIETVARAERGSNEHGASHPTRS
jgi:uncharacterized protein YbjT (DUF2867 family)